MNPERWAEIEKLYHAALEHEPEERAAFLAQCSEEEVRKEVQSLLDHEQSGDRLMDNPAWKPPSGPSLAAGTRLGPYEIISSIGAGGMGEVYRARDTKLGRDVAIKVLPDTLAHDPDRLARFNREAKLLASLNHPNIAHVYGVESQALVMELVEGDALSSVLKSGPLAIKTALNYGRQIAEALEAAHEKGVIHRDLKPQNIMIARSGLVKVLDFGLAKTDEPPTGGDPAQSPTLLLSPTRTGVILGTAAYMSPEQARGKAADRRTDIWSFGAVLYEMLSGQPAFRGESVTEILAGVLRGEPDWKALPKGTPSRIRRLLRKCLERDRERRVQSIREARIDLDAALTERTDSPFAYRLKVAIAGIVVVAALTGTVWFLMHRQPKPMAEPGQKRLTFNSSDNPIWDLAISLDGKYLAYSDSAGIHLRSLSTGDERLVPRPPGVSPNTYWQVDSWFPDGTRLLADAYEPGGHKSMWTISVVGQNPRHLRDGGSGFGVSPDGMHIAYGQGGTTDDIRELWVMGVEGDKPQKLFGVGAGESLQCAKWSPDGQRLAYIRYEPSAEPEPHSSIETWELRRAGRTIVLAGFSAHSLYWLPEGRIVFGGHESGSSQDINLWQIGIDNHTGAPVGKPKRITTWFGSTDLLSFSATADGKRLALLKQTNQAQIYLAELEAGGKRIKSSRRLTNDEAEDWPFSWTADNKAVLFNSKRNGIIGIYKQQISQENEEQVFTDQDAQLPRITPDGAWVLFMVGQTASPQSPAAYRLMRAPLSGGTPQFVMNADRPLNFVCPNRGVGSCVIFEESDDKKQVLITAFDPQKGRGKLLRTVEKHDPSENYQSALSPNGLTCALSQIGESEIRIRLLSLSGATDSEIRVKGWPSASGVDWSSDGKGFYCGSSSPSGTRLLYVDPNGNAHEIWKNKGGYNSWGIPSPDGRYLAIGGNVMNSNAWIVEGF